MSKSFQADMAGIPGFEKFKDNINSWMHIELILFQVKQNNRPNSQVQTKFHFGLVRINAKSCFSFFPVSSRKIFFLFSSHFVFFSLQPGLIWQICEGDGNRICYHKLSSDRRGISKLNFLLTQNTKFSKYTGERYIKNFFIK